MALSAAAVPVAVGAAWAVVGREVLVAGALGLAGAAGAAGRGIWSCGM